jgi:hypothetical protein
MKLVILLLFCLLLCGCTREWLAPDTDKAYTEKAQLMELEKQNIIFMDIANSLNLIAESMK